jgi:hypothetical protein
VKHNVKQRNLVDHGRGDNKWLNGESVHFVAMKLSQELVKSMSRKMVPFLISVRINARKT